MSRKHDTSDDDPFEDVPDASDQSIPDSVAGPKPTVENLLLRREDHLRKHYGTFGVDIHPQVATHDRITALLAVLDEEGTKAIYDPDGELWEQLQVVKDRIEDDLQEAIEDEFDD